MEEGEQTEEETNDNTKRTKFSAVCCVTPGSTKRCSLNSDILPSTTQRVIISSLGKGLLSHTQIQKCEKFQATKRTMYSLSALLGKSC